MKATKHTTDTIEMFKNFANIETADLNEYPLKLFLATRDRFDLEQDLLKVWELSDDIERLTAEYMDGKNEISQDKLWGYLDAIKNMHEMRMERMWDTFCQVLELDGYYQMENAPTLQEEKKSMKGLDEHAKKVVKAKNAKATSPKKTKPKTVAKKTASKKTTKAVK